MINHRSYREYYFEGILASGLPIAGRSVALHVALHILCGTFNPGPCFAALTIPALENLSSSLTPAQPKGQAGCQRQCTSETHEKGIYQRLSNPDLVDRDNNAEAPDSHTCNGRQKVRVTQSRLRRCTTYKVA